MKDLQWSLKINLTGVWKLIITVFQRLLTTHVNSFVEHVLIDFISTIWKLVNFSTHRNGEILFCAKTAFNNWYIIFFIRKKVMLPFDITHFMRLVSFSTTRKYQKTSGFQGVRKEENSKKWVKLLLMYLWTYSIYTGGFFIYPLNHK